MYEELFMVLFCPFYTKTQFRTFVIVIVKINRCYTCFDVRQSDQIQIYLIYREEYKTQRRSPQKVRKKTRNVLRFATQNMTG